MFTCLFLAVSCIVTLGIGVFIFGLIMCDDIKNDLSSIRKCGYAADDKANTTKQFIQFIKYHSESRKLVSFSNFPKGSFLIRFFLVLRFLSRLIGLFSNILQPIFIVVLLWSTITICSGMLVIQSELVKYSVSARSETFFKRKSLNERL